VVFTETLSVTLGTEIANAGVAVAVVYGPSKNSCCWSLVNDPDVVLMLEAIVLLAVTVVPEKLNVELPLKSQSPGVSVMVAPFAIVLLAIEAAVEDPVIISPIKPVVAVDASVTPRITFEIILPVAVPAKTGEVIVAPEEMVAAIEMFDDPSNDVADPVTSPEIAIVLGVFKVDAEPLTLPVTLPVKFPVTFPITLPNISWVKVFCPVTV
jgi:hypothetical protein